MAGRPAARDSCKFGHARFSPGPASVSACSTQMLGSTYTAWLCSASQCTGTSASGTITSPVRSNGSPVHSRHCASEPAMTIDAAATRLILPPARKSHCPGRGGDRAASIRCHRAQVRKGARDLAEECVHHRISPHELRPLGINLINVVNQVGSLAEAMNYHIGPDSYRMSTPSCGRAYGRDPARLHQPVPDLDC